MDNEKIKKQFLADVKKHTMTVKHDNGLYRHLRFCRGNSSVYYFSLITWPGSLCIEGDMGTYVFQRALDMFTFFRQNDLKINDSYWGEKLQAIDPHTGYKKYSEKEFRETVKWHYDCAAEGEPETYTKDLWSHIEDSVLYYSGEKDAAYQAVYDFSHNRAGRDFRFDDFDYSDCEDYTAHYIWCLYAIVWGIQKYDKEERK
ncbi:MAG: hypothetical protein GY757_19175 [bacterium]|nr:hypothetical protein [bacterium]